MPSVEEMNNQPPSMKSPLQEAGELEKKAEELEKEADKLEAHSDEVDKRYTPMDYMFQPQRVNLKQNDADSDRGTAKWKRDEAVKLRKQAEELRKLVEDPDEVSNMLGGANEKPPIESVIPDLGWKPEKKIDSVLPDVGPGSWNKATPQMKALGLGVLLLLLAGAYWGLSGGNKGGQPAPKAAPAAAKLDADGAFGMDGKKYYRVISNDDTRNTGDKACALVGKKCVGYTALNLDVCMAFHPGAQPSTDYNGSKAGFFCNGAPQGGVCAQESNTCHICPQCNLNMECSTVIGDLYRETFVECK